MTDLRGILDIGRGRIASRGANRLRTERGGVHLDRDLYLTGPAGVLATVGSSEPIKRLTRPLLGLGQAAVMFHLS